MLRYHFSSDIESARSAIRYWERWASETRNWFAFRICLHWRMATSSPRRFSISLSFSVMKRARKRETITILKSSDNSSLLCRPSCPLRYSIQRPSAQEQPPRAVKAVPSDTSEPLFFSWFTCIWWWKWLSDSVGEQYSLEATSTDCAEDSYATGLTFWNAGYAILAIQLVCAPVTAACAPPGLTSEFDDGADTSREANADDDEGVVASETYSDTC